MSEIAVRLGERLRHLRKERGFSQERLGEITGLHEKYIGQVERGEKNLSIDSLYKISDGLNITLEELFRGLDPMIREDDLGLLMELLIHRPKADHTMILRIAGTIFERLDNDL